MSYNYNTNLTNLQSLNRYLFSPPSNSLSSSAYNKIHHYESNKILKYNIIYSDVMTRVYAFAIPLFALMDVIRFAGEILFRAVTLDKNGVQYALLNCAKALKLFILIIPVWIPSIFKPDLVLRNDLRWQEIQKEQTIKKMEKTLNSLVSQRDLKTGFEEILHEEIEDYVICPEIKSLFYECLRELVASLPTDPEKMEVVVSHYINLAATFLVQAANERISFSEKKCFLEIFTELVQIRDPDLRERLLKHVLAKEKLWKELTQPIDLSSTTSPLFSFLARQLTSDPELLGQLSKLSKSSHLNNLVNRRNFYSMLLVIQKRELSPETKNLLLSKVVELAKGSSHEGAKKLAPKKIATLISKKKKEKQSKEEKYQKSLEGLAEQTIGTTAYSQAKNLMQQYKSNLEKVEAEILDLEAALALSAHGEKPVPQIAKGLQNLSILLSLPSNEMLEEVLSKIGKETAEETGYFHISDKEIVEDLFKRIFECDKSATPDFENLKRIRSPEALLKFQLRLMENNSSDRQAILDKNRAVFLSVLKGTFYEERFNEEQSIHLKTVFAGRPDLKREWCRERPPVKVSTLVAHPSKAYKDFEIVIAKDPSDMLLIGNDLGTCVNLEGRLSRVTGLLGYLADGKTHTLLAKQAGDAVSAAETQLQLMWDAQNNQPVLFLEQTNYAGSAKGDHTLESAMIAYAKNLSEELGITLVSCYRNHDDNVSFLSDRYSGTVESLGCPSPIEYVNSHYSNMNGVYDVGTCYVVHAKTKIQKLFSCAQWPKCNGSTKKTLALRTVRQLNKKTVSPVSFNKEKITGHVDGGNCTSLAFDFGKRALALYNQNLPMNEMVTKISEWKSLYEAGDAGDISKMRSYQEAFNTIEVQKGASIDLSRRKIEAMAKFYDLDISQASPEFKILHDQQNRAIEIMKDLQNGVHFLRIIKPLDNDKQEEFGHSLVCIKKDDEVLFYDPSDSLEYINSKYLGDRIFHHFNRCIQRWDVQDARFYKLA
ncbi:hypothetical protein [Estrella lausannensis]|uniref:Putative membrane protein n=1 Tax=Estrella lausannensis TaxID=483423 RepID=A0A0H5DS53_9BACT|nr:hypothetical protein [Estrella lausannensis]CRX39507.1 putative membrane protein [Estrella lausannensis]